MIDLAFPAVDESISGLAARTAAISAKILAAEGSRTEGDTLVTLQWSRNLGHRESY